MNIRMAFFLFVLTFSLQGCFWPFHSGWKTFEILSPVSVQILNEEAFKREGAIVFVPFAAGTEAEAGPEVDRLALVIIKSTADTLAYSPSTLRVSSDQDLSLDRYILDGRIEELKEPRGILFRKKGVLRLKAELRDKHSGEVLVVISGQKYFRKVIESERAASEIGRDIAEGLLR